MKRARHVSTHRTRQDARRPEPRSGGRVVAGHPGPPHRDASGRSAEARAAMPLRSTAPPAGRPARGRGRPACRSACASSATARGGWPRRQVEPLAGAAGVVQRVGDVGARPGDVGRGQRAGRVADRGREVVLRIGDRAGSRRAPARPRTPARRRSAARCSGVRSMTSGTAPSRPPTARPRRRRARRRGRPPAAAARARHPPPAGPARSRPPARRHATSSSRSDPSSAPDRAARSTRCGASAPVTASTTWSRLTRPATKARPRRRAGRSGVTDTGIERTGVRLPALDARPSPVTSPDVPDYRDVLARRAGAPGTATPPVPEVAAEPELVVETADGAFCGAVVGGRPGGRRGGEARHRDARGPARQAAGLRACCRPRSCSTAGR